MDLKQRCTIAGEGLRSIFKALAIGVLLGAMALVGKTFFAVALVGAVVLFAMYFGGIYQLRPVHPGYQRAFGVLVGSFALVLADAFLPEEPWGPYLDVASDVLSFLVIFFIIDATCDLLREMGQEREPLARRGEVIIRLHAVVVLVEAVCGLFFEETMVGALVLMVTDLVELVLSLAQLAFLHDASRALLGGPVEREGL